MKFSPLVEMETYVSKVKTHRVPLADFTPGLHYTPHVFFKLEMEGTVPWVIDRVCDHAGGTLRFSDTDAGTAVCPLHNWEFDFSTLSYSSIPNQAFEHITKKPIPYAVEDGILSYSIDQRSLRVPLEVASDTAHKAHAKLRFITHASVMLDVDGVKLVTDPWFVGECLACGWWLKYPPKADAWKLLEAADVIYISHNHPDHLHAETLSRVRRDMPIIVPAFETESVVKPLRDMGFTHVIPLKTKQLYRVNDSELLISILPTGDHREDSALFIQKGDFSTVLTVDCVGANQYVLPKDLTMLLTNFASGASGWPLCYDVVGDMEVRSKIVTKGRGNTMLEVMKYIAATNPKVYVPYAGYFNETAPRDTIIEEYNIKNSPQSVIDKVKVKFPDVLGVNPLIHDVVTWKDGQVCLSAVDAAPLFTYDDATINSYLDAQRALLKNYDIHKIADYFCQSEFRDELIAYIVMTDDDYVPEGQALRIDFSTMPMRYEVVDGAVLLAEFMALTELRGYHHMLLKVRTDSMWHIVYHGRPLEELSLGFQCRIDRKPDQYNAAFWKHYTTHGAPMLRRGEDHLLYKLLDGVEST